MFSVTTSLEHVLSLAIHRLGRVSRTQDADCCSYCALPQRVHWWLHRSELLQVAAIPKQYVVDSMMDVTRLFKGKTRVSLPHGGSIFKCYWASLEFAQLGVRS